MDDCGFAKSGAEQAAGIIGALVAARRASSKWTTQAGFGSEVGVSGQTVSQTELGNVSPRLSLMCAWAAAFGYRLELVPEGSGCGDEPTDAELSASEPTGCGMCEGEGYVEARDGQTSSVFFEGQSFVVCPSCNDKK